MMKKIVVVLLSLLLVVSLCACSIIRDRITDVFGNVVKKGGRLLGGDITEKPTVTPRVTEAPEYTIELQDDPTEEPTPEPMLEPTPEPTPEPAPRPTPETTKISPEDFSIAVQNSVDSRLSEKNYEMAKVGQKVNVSDFIEFTVNKTDVFNPDLYDNIKYVDVTVTVRKADTVNYATIVSEDFMLTGKKNGESQFAFATLWYTKQGEFNEFPIKLTSDKAVKLVLSFKVHGDFMRELLIQTNVYTDGTEAGSLYIVNVKS